MKFAQPSHTLTITGKWSLSLAFVLAIYAAATPAADTDRLRETVQPALANADTNSASAKSDSLATLRSSALAFAAQIVDMRGNPMVSGLNLGNGYFLTKSSEVPNIHQARILTDDGLLLEMREIKRDPALDLTLAKVKGISQSSGPNRLEPGKDVTFGQWLASPARGGGELCIGVLSASSRKIPGMGAAIGVRMDDKPAGKAGGVRIIGVAEDSPAALAGLRPDDILLEVGGQPIARYRQVNEIVSVRQPGEEIEVRFRRRGHEDRVTIRLASKTKILANWDGEDFANGGVSIRTDNFAQVLQHDLPLGPKDMGAPLFDLDGRLVGINIARVDRVTTFALPASLFWDTVQKWIAADRNPGKVVDVKGDSRPAKTEVNSTPAAPETPSRPVRLHRAR